MSQPRFDLLELSQRAPVHFMGAGGAGMSPLAEFLLRSGGAVTGCDRRADSGSVLQTLGASIYEGHDPAHVVGASALVITSAVPSDHPEVNAAREAGIPVLKRAEALGACVNQGKLVAIAGTHGKTTTTALTTHVLAAASLDPTGLVGGHVLGWEGNLRFGRGDLFVVEADEYDRSFHTLTPDVAVVTNLEADHLDIYGDLAGVVQGFSTFLDGMRDGAVLWCCADDHGAATLAAGRSGDVRTYGLSAGSTLRAIDVEMDLSGARFTVVEQGAPVGTIRLPVPGEHNVRNALAAVGVSRSLGADWTDIREGLASFPGVGRRFNNLGTVGGVTVIDDYAHHPSELEAALGAAKRAFEGRRIVAVFQPHLFSRTRDFTVEFGTALALADEAWVTEIYPAREEPIPGVTGRIVHDAVATAGGHSRFHGELETLPDVLGGHAKEGDVFVVMGAGSIERTGQELLRTLEEVLK